MGVDNPLVSVVIPVHNGARFLGATIESVFRQRYRPIEVLVVDDGSTDGSDKIASAFAGVSILTQARRGPSAARNRGLDEAAGDLITFIDADDQMTGNGLTAQVHRLLNHNNIQCVFGHAKALMDAEIVAPDWLNVPTGHDTLVPFASALFRTVDLRGVGGFDVLRTVGEWFELFTRLREGPFEIAVIDEQVLVRRVHGDNLSYQQENMQQGMFRSLKQRLERQRMAEAAEE